MFYKENIYNNMSKLVLVPGVSGTDNEKLTALKIEELLYEIPYFQKHKDAVKQIPVENDPFGRSIVIAFLEAKEKTDRTIILSGHYDVVDVEEFGHLKDHAYDIEKITKLIHEMPLDDDSKKDLESGEWIFGRGTADMKYGIALCLELLRYFSEEELLSGNLLFAAVCGEETNSEGMLRAVPYFNQLKKEKDLRYDAFLLTECYMMEDQTKDTNRYIHFGASGKIMPMFFFVGESTHGGEPFLGIDPNLMAAEVYKRMHLNADFCQIDRGEVTPPPVCLKSQDLKTTYSVSTPLYTASYYNIITTSINPDEAMEKLLEIAGEAFEASCEFMGEKIAAYKGKTGENPVHMSVTPCIKTFQEIYEDVKKSTNDLDSRIEKLVKEMQDNHAELQDICIQLIKTVYELYKDKQPMIIVGIIPPYYPNVYPDEKSPEVRKLLDNIDSIIQYAREAHGETLKKKNYYMGISDMCYTGLDQTLNFDKLFENLIGINQVYTFPQEELKQFRVPGMVLGGYGKDFHKYTERLHRHYNFDVLPDLYIKFIKDQFS